MTTSLDLLTVLVRFHSGIKYQRRIHTNRLHLCVIPNFVKLQRKEKRVWLIKSLSFSYLRSHCCALTTDVLPKSQCTCVLFYYFVWCTYSMQCTWKVLRVIADNVPYLDLCWVIVRLSSLHLIMNETKRFGL